MDEQQPGDTLPILRAADAGRSSVRLSQRVTPQRISLSADGAKPRVPKGLTFMLQYPQLALSAHIDVNRRLEIRDRVARRESRPLGAREGNVSCSPNQIED